LLNIIISNKSDLDHDFWLLLLLLKHIGKVGVNDHDEPNEAQKRDQELVSEAPNALLSHRLLNRLLLGQRSLKLLGRLFLFALELLHALLEGLFPLYPLLLLQLLKRGRPLPLLH
jgi:hypothetical protein